LKDLREGADERLLEKIARIIPGYGGYKDKELRREADKAQRMYLSRRLGEIRSDLVGVNSELTNEGKLDALGEADRIGKRLEKIADRVKFASYGYAGFFDLVKVREEELDRMYEFDASLLEKVDGLKRGVGELLDTLDNPESTGEKLGELNLLIGDMEKKLNEREDLLKGMS
jgi:hypothetical protein